MTSEQEFFSQWREINQIHPHFEPSTRSYIFNLALSPNGKFLLINCDTTQLWVWQEGKMLWFINDFETYQFSECGSYLMYAGVDFAGMTAYMPYEKVIAVDSGKIIYDVKYGDEFTDVPLYENGRRPVGIKEYNRSVSTTLFEHHILYHQGGQYAFIAEKKNLKKDSYPFIRVCHKID